MAMRTITKTAQAVLELQAKEALIQSRSAETEDKRNEMAKISETLKHQVKSVEAREDKDTYVYTKHQLTQDVEDTFWKAAIRISDYFDINLDAVETNRAIEDLAAKFIGEMRMKLGNSHGVGAHEPKVPGEENTYVSIEVEDIEE